VKHTTSKRATFHLRLRARLISKLRVRWAFLTVVVRYWIEQLMPVPGFTFLSMIHGVTPLVFLCFGLPSVPRDLGRKPTFRLRQRAKIQVERESVSVKNGGRFKGAIRIPLHSLSLFFSHLALPRVPRKSLKSLALLLSIPTTRTQQDHCPRREPTSNSILRLSIIVCIMLHSWSTCEELKWRLLIDL
jgi:hypothetical protein